MNFYEQTSSCVSRLSPTEQNLFNYIIKNLHIVKDMSIRDLSEKCFVSTTSIFRLVKKLGYQGYAEFSQALRDTEEESRKIHMPSIVSADNYRDSYLKNVIEAVKVITDEKINKFNAIMNRNPNIFILAEGLSHEVGRYFYRLMTMMGFNTEMPDEEYEFVSVLAHTRAVAAAGNGKEKAAARPREREVCRAQREDRAHFRHRHADHRFTHTCRQQYDPEYERFEFLCFCR